MSLSIPMNRRLVEVEIPSDARPDVRTVIARTLVIEQDYLKRKGKRVNNPESWAAGVVANIVSDADDPGRWAARVKQLSYRINVASDQSTDSEELDKATLLDRLFFGKLETGEICPISDGLRVTLMQIAGHAFHNVGCDICHGIYKREDAAPLLNSTRTDMVLFRIVHAGLVKVDCLPPYQKPVDQAPTPAESRYSWSPEDDLDTL